MAGPRAVIFDVDGTLVDSNDLHVQCWQEAFRHFGKDVPFDAIRRQVGKGGDQMLPVFFSPDELKRFGKELSGYRTKLYQRDYLPKVKPWPRVRELMQRVHDDGKKIALATSSKKDEVETLIKLIACKDILDVVTTGDDAERTKPAPDIFEAALSKLDLNAADAIAVGDTPYDGEASRKLRLPIVGMLCGGFSEEWLRQAGCCMIYKDPADLLQHYVKSPLAEKPLVSCT